MIENPFGPLWKEEDNPNVYHRIRQRLWRSARVFEGNVKDIHKALQELQQKLNIDANGQPLSVKEGISIKKELKRLSFALNQAVYQDLLTRIRDGVSGLARLISDNSDLEPERKKRSDWRIHRLMSFFTASVYQALCAAMSACPCPTSHLLGLQLGLSSFVSATPDDEDEHVAKRLSVKLAVPDEKIPHGKNSRQWQSIMVKPFRPARQCQVPIFQQPTAPVEPERPAKRARRTVGFSFSEKPTTKRPGLLSRYSSREVEMTSTWSSISSTQTLTMAVGTTNTELTNEDMIMDICETLRDLSILKGSSCCGHITGPASIDTCATEKYGIYALGHLRPSGELGHCSFVSLHEILTALPHSSFRFFYEDKLKLAHTLATSVLQLAGTPWLTTRSTAKDVFLIQCDGKPHFQEAFIIKQLPETSPDLMQIDSPPSQELAALQAKEGLLFLGIILIEIMLETPFDTFRKSHTSSTMESFLTDFQTANSLLGRLEMQGQNYKRAVERCLKCPFPAPKPYADGDDFRKLFYGHVVTPLEQDLNAFLQENPSSG
ncbi:hypothetical protein B0T20DRAFT_365025 [Sordaria brevicollis]|uniref:DUF7580 domain-containing protein n=1 Tax=Sordaria brevicollis TaxID=83679 RepID=A0AAE0NV99_SORBR|nr:hypothetical protein B0T20DRAFT_365025 [Sordaria brevicollis]